MPDSHVKPRERRNAIGPTNRTVGENVRRVRSQLGMTQADVVRTLDANGHPIPLSSIGRIESGDRRVEVDDLLALSIALGVSPLALLLPAARSPHEQIEVTGWGAAQAGRAWAFALGTSELEDLDYDDDLPQPTVAGRSFPWWAEQEAKRFYGVDQTTS